MRYLTLILIVVTSACATGKIDWLSLSAREKQEAVLIIGKKCILPADRMQIVGDAEMYFRPHPGDSYTAVDCALGELKHYRGIKLGFVGNEAYIENMQ